MGEEVNEAARIEAGASGGLALASKALIERLIRGDSNDLELDHVAYTPLGDLSTATEKARRDAPLISVCETQTRHHTVVRRKGRPYGRTGGNTNRLASLTRFAWWPEVAPLSGWSWKKSENALWTWTQRDQEWAADSGSVTKSMSRSTAPISAGSRST